MKSKFKSFGIITLGLILIGVPSLYAGDMAALEDIAANREAWLQAWTEVVLR